MVIEFFIENRIFEQEISNNHNSRTLSFDAYLLGDITIGSGEKINQGLFSVEDNSDQDEFVKKELCEMYSDEIDLRFFVTARLPANSFQALMEYDQEKYVCKVSISIYPDENIFSGSTYYNDLSWDTKNHRHIKCQDVTISIKPQVVFFSGYLRENKQSEEIHNNPCRYGRGLSIQKAITVEFNNKYYAGFYFVVSNILTVVSTYGDCISRPAVADCHNEREAVKILQELLEGAKSQGKLK